MTPEQLKAIRGRAQIMANACTYNDVMFLLMEIDRMHTAIRKHRDYRGDDRCHLDDGELYSVLPEGDTRPERDTAVTIENCQRFIECRQQGREYVSPEREIEKLRQERDDAMAGDPALDLIHANRDAVLTMHQEAVQRIGYCLRRGDNETAAMVLHALTLFHPMHTEMFPGWPEGSA